MLNDVSCVRFFCMTREASAPEIACKSRKQKLYRLNRPLRVFKGQRRTGTEKNFKLNSAWWVIPEILNSQE